MPCGKPLRVYVNLTINIGVRQQLRAKTVLTWRIAAIALSLDAIVVTRNQRDLKLVAGLVVCTFKVDMYNKIRKSI